MSYFDRILSNKFRVELIHNLSVMTVVTGIYAEVKKLIA
jgi:hypothetical protein